MNMKIFLKSLAFATSFSIAIISTPAMPQIKPDRPINSCCDPVLASLNYKPMFAEDLMPGGNVTSPYGLKFTPTPALNAAMDNTAFISAVMAGISTAPTSLNWLVLEGNMRTDNVANSSWPTTTPFAVLWNAMTPNSINPTSRVLAYNQVFQPSGTVVGSPNPFGYAELNTWSASSSITPRHLRPDGTRYLAELDFWIYTLDFDSKPIKLTKRPVNCSNFDSVYVDFDKDHRARRGAGTALNVVSQIEMAGQNTRRAAARNVSQVLTAAEVAALPKEMRDAMR